MKYTLANRQQLTDKIMLVTLAPKNSNFTNFHPGQYVALRFKRFGRPTPARCFSIVNARNGRGELQFAIRNRGKFTAALSKLPLNSDMTVDGPFGDFVYDPDFDRHSVMIAGGIGITPIMAIIRDSLRQGYPNTITLLYSVQYEKDAIFADELLQLAAKHQNFKVIFSVTRGEIKRFNRRHAINGRISQELIDRAVHRDYQNTSFFICGPVGFLSNMKGIIDSNKAPAIRINTEAFTQAQAAQDTNGLLRSGLTPSSIYSLAAIAFVVVLTTIMLTDISANVTKAKKVSPATSTSATSTGSNYTTDTTTTPTTSDTSTTNNGYVSSPSSNSQSYQQPVSTVS